MLQDIEETDPELISMKAYLDTENIVIQDAGSYPLITYCGPNTQQAMDILQDNGQHLRACALAARQGIPFDKFGLMLLNLDDAKDIRILKDGQWCDSWNGIWIHQSHGRPGACLIDKLQGDGTIIQSQELGVFFYAKYGQHIMKKPAFGYALINSCFAARQPSPTLPSFIEQLQKEAVRLLHKMVRVCGANIEVWTPLYGAQYGIPLIVPEPFFAICDGLERQRDSYFTGSYLDIELGGKKFTNRANERRYVAALTEKYFAEAGFNLDMASPIIERTNTAFGSTKWYFA